MLEAFVIVLREGFEAFLIVAITLAYLRKSGKQRLIPAVRLAIAAAIALSGVFGYILMRGVNQSLWEAILGSITVVLVATLVIHMWRTAPRMRREMERRLERATAQNLSWIAFAGVFLFTLVMVTREGMETALMLYQVRGGILVGALFGLAAAASLAWLWARLGHRINLKRFFQVTSIYLLLFMGQVGVYSFHEFAEAGVFPKSEELHAATEILSPYGLYGKWFSILIVVLCAGWLAVAWILDLLKVGTVRAKSLQS